MKAQIPSQKTQHKNLVIKGELGTDQDHTHHPQHTEMRYQLVIAVLNVSI